ncbi:MAG: glycosyltransferase family 2 protein, partial [Anaerolineales bacterium]
MPVSRSNEDGILASIQSVINQTYRWWQLRLVIDRAQEAETREYVEQIEEDDRIQVILKDDPNQTERSFANVLNLESVDFAAVLYPGDLLAPNALWEVAKVLNERPEVDLIYSDQDRMDPPDRRRKNPWFKPDWSPELLLSVNYLYPAFIRMSLIEATPDMTALLDYETAWGFLLNYTQKVSHIVHIPKVLCHLGSGIDERKPPAEGDVRTPASGSEGVGRYLQYIGVDGAQATMTAHRSVRVTWPSKTALVSIIIPTRDNSRWLKRCIDSLRNFMMKPPYEIILVDNQSQESETKRLFERLKLDNRIRVIPFEQPFNFSAANNSGASQSLGDLLLFLNDDVEIIEDGWLEEMARWAERPEIGVVGAKLLYPDLTIQHTGVILGMGGHAGHVFWGEREGIIGPLGSTEWYRNYMAVTGACMMISRRIFNEVGGFDERYQLAFGDV